MYSVWFCGGLLMVCCWAANQIESSSIKVDTETSFTHTTDMPTSNLRTRH